MFSCERLEHECEYLLSAALQIDGAQLTLPKPLLQSLPGLALSPPHQHWAGTGRCWENSAGEEELEDKCRKKNLNCVSLPKSNDGVGFEACFLLIHVCAWRGSQPFSEGVPESLPYSIIIVILWKINFLPSEEYGSRPLSSPIENDREIPGGLNTCGLTLHI